MCLFSLTMIRRIKVSNLLFHFDFVVSLNSTDQIGLINFIEGHKDSENIAMKSENTMDEENAKLI